LDDRENIITRLDRYELPLTPSLIKRGKRRSRGGVQKEMQEKLLPGEIGGCGTYFEPALTLVPRVFGITSVDYHMRR
jgi:hypothetical protein